MRTIYSRIHPRRRSYDYGLPGSYFVTTITHERKPVFGILRSGGVALSASGEIATRFWSAVPPRFAGVTIDTFVVMPDHVHAIVSLSADPNRTATLSQVVGWAKQRTAREIHLIKGEAAVRIWQRSFHERIIRDADEFKRIRRYITANPERALTNASYVIRWPRR